MKSEDNFRLSEAVGLCSALVGYCSFGAMADLMIIKGIALDYHKLRCGYIPQDVDSLARPSHFRDATEALLLGGWSRRPAADLPLSLDQHSVTLTSPGWPCDADIHDRFPGMLAGPELAFEVLWAHRERMMVAGHSAWIPDRGSSIVIWALHSLRGTASQARHSEELRQLVEDVLPKLSEAERQELADRIVELGADEPLRVVPEFAEIIGDRHGPQAPGALAAWQAKVAQAHEASPWLQVLREARPRERPWLLYRAVWPSAHDLRLIDEALVDTPLGRVQSRGRRAGRLVRRVIERRRRAS